jgi:hypothetical protein
MIMKLAYNLCSICKHRRPKGQACDAFPDEIPRDIRMMYADHRLPYPGDQGIEFAILETQEAREQLRKVKVLKKPRPRPSELDRQVAAVVKALPCRNAKERRQFALVVVNADTFKQLPWAYQQLILEEEQLQRPEIKQHAPAQVRVS